MLTKDKIKDDMIEFFHQLGFTLCEIKDNCFREQEGSTFIFQTDHKDRTVDCSTILYDDAVKIYSHLTAQYEKLIGECISEERQHTGACMRGASFRGKECCCGALAFNQAVFNIRTSLQERGIKIK